MGWLSSLIESAHESTQGLSGQTVCLTGIFEAGTHQEISEMILEQGGIPVSSGGDWINILVVGSKGNAQYCNGDEGHKIITAKNSPNTMIVDEKDFLAAC